MKVLKLNKFRNTVLSIKFTIALFIFFTLIITTPAIAKNLTDHLGRTVAVPDNPGRVISLSPSITEIVFAIGQGKKLVGATKYSDFPEETGHLPKVGSYVRLDLEKIVALKPDLCLSIKDGNPKELIERLISMRIAVFVVEARNVESVMNTIDDMGKIFNAEDSAAAVVGDMRARIDKIKSITGKAKQKPGVFYQIGITPIVSAGTDSVINELIEIAGGDNLAKGPKAYPRFSKEQVIALAPDVFIISSMAEGEVFEKIKAEWSSWVQIPAVKNKRIHLIKSGIVDRPGPRMVQGIEMLARLIHPELFDE